MINSWYAWLLYTALLAPRHWEISHLHCNMNINFTIEGHVGVRQYMEFRLLVNRHVRKIVLGFWLRSESKKVSKRRCNRRPWWSDRNELFLLRCIAREIFTQTCYKNPSQYLNLTFHFAVRQRRQKLILHQILDAYPRIDFINKGLSIFQKPHVRCDYLKVIWFIINSN